MIEFIFGFALGRITKNSSPLELVVGFLGALVLISLLSATLWMVWASTPYAYEVIRDVGIIPTDIVEYLRVKDVADGNLIDFVFQIPKRLMVFSLAMLVLMGGLAVAFIALRGSIDLIKRTMKIVKPKTGI